ncbi:MAG: hypothetical protein IKX33_10820 [Prevotella sp.]|nr:hypothetical protein [Prevotella sp.]
MKPKNTWGLLFDQDDKERVIEDEGVMMTSHDTDNIVGPQWLMGSYAPAVYWKNSAGAHNQIIIREEIMADWAKRWAWLK